MKYYFKIKKKGPMLNRVGGSRTSLCLGVFSFNN